MFRYAPRGNRDKLGVNSGRGAHLAGKPGLVLAISRETYRESASLHSSSLHRQDFGGQKRLRPPLTQVQLANYSFFTPAWSQLLDLSPNMHQFSRNFGSGSHLE